MDTADACHERGIKTVAVTAGYIHAEPRIDFYAKMDAANVDLKAFTDEFYVKQTGSHLQPVLETLQYLQHETDVWYEITTLLIPGLNDSDAELHAMCEWIAEHLGPDVPLHFTAFHPDYKLRGTGRYASCHTGQARGSHAARDCATSTPAMVDLAGGTTHCPACEQSLIARDWHQITDYQLGHDGHCPCGEPITGHFDASPDHSAADGFRCVCADRASHRSTARCSAVATAPENATSTIRSSGGRCASVAVNTRSATSQAGSSG